MTDTQRYDAIVIGGGHNGLTNAAYLAKAGQRVLVLEQHNIVGGAAITEELQRRLGVTREEAESQKVMLATAPPEARETVAQVVEQLAAEIQRSLDFYLATSGDRQIDAIWVTGGTANLPLFVEALRRRVSFDPASSTVAGPGAGAGTQVGLLDVMRMAPPDPKTVNPLELQGREAQIAVAMGLALRKEREKR